MGAGSLSEKRLFLAPEQLFYLGESLGNFVDRVRRLTDWPRIDDRSTGVAIQSLRKPDQGALERLGCGFEGRRGR